MPVGTTEKGTVRTVSSHALTSCFDIETSPVLRFFQLERSRCGLDPCLLCKRVCSCQVGFKHGDLPL